MNLTLDANILVSELTRDGGIAGSLLTHPALETLYIAEYTWDEAVRVLDNRLNAWRRGGRLDESAAVHFKTIATAFAESRCTLVEEDIYTVYESEARRRIPDDPDDWHTVALALTTETSIWTLDQRHFFGCGVAVWKTTVLRDALAPPSPPR